MTDCGGPRPASSSSTSLHGSSKQTPVGQTIVPISTSTGTSTCPRTLASISTTISSSTETALCASAPLRTTSCESEQARDQRRSRNTAKTGSDTLPSLVKWWPLPERGTTLQR